MSQFLSADNYRPCLGLYDTQRAIGFIKHDFLDLFSASLNLQRVSAPLFVEAGLGLNDDLNGVERPVDFTISDTGKSAQVVQSLAKWKRVALRDYGFKPGKGLICDMNAIRRDEELDNLHSVYVDQWDWEKIILPEQRCREVLESTVRQIVSAICATELNLHARFSDLDRVGIHSNTVAFVTTGELEELYPTLSRKEREDAFVREHGTSFIEQIGYPLKDGRPHDGRAPDYDDWSLNGDILFWNEPLRRSFEISSMGIRVDPQSLKKQLALSGHTDREKLMYHRELLAGRLPLTIGGGIGQSRLCMLLLGCAHIGEVQTSVWDDETLRHAREAGITLL